MLRLGTGVLQEDLGDAVGLLEGGEVSGVGQRHRSGAKQGEGGFAFWRPRPIVIAVDQVTGTPTRA